MKVNKLYAGVALASTIILTGCGDDNDGGPIVNNELNYAVFEPFTDVVNNSYREGLGKIEYKLSNNGLIQTISTVIGSSLTAYQDSRSDDDELEYYAGKNAFATVPENFDNKFYKINFVDSDTFTLKFQSNNSTFNSTYDIVTLDLTGVGKNPRNADTGLYTDLYYFEGSNATFPSGSQCYIILETPEQNYYSFADGDWIGSMTIEQWIANEREWNTVTNLVRDNIGLNNELPAARYTDEDGDIIAVVKYKGLIYDASYHQKEIQEKENTDPNVSEVYCNQYNNVATKFLETQFKDNYIR